LVAPATLLLRVPKRNDRHSLRLSSWMTGASLVNMRWEVWCYIPCMKFVLTFEKFHFF
jgi:hypothetical protein